MDQKEEHQKDGDEEVDGARGLLAAQQSDRGGKYGGDGGGHGQAGPDHQREENEDHGQIGQALEDVVGPGIGSAGRLKRRWLPRLPWRSAPGKIGAVREQISAEMSV